ncbi:PKD domain-containing protein [Rufibacter sediminis]|uniref:PKD domain-containing protein n=1 Tax=Rufibacter sediminis TaxID=2762756 RepID=A0ABR6VS45_9BACT|nr:PKD domain-containing protein [Rufibacter sediminis]MBC3540018.1 PKD domain-containing protein [Rufibacter sediminis]
MKKYITYITFLFLASFVWTGCELDDPELGTPPTPQQVTFTHAYDTENPNIVHFKSTAPGFKAIWDFGNGSSAEGAEVDGAYPLAGDYTVKLTIYTSGGSASSSKTINIEKTNPLMLDREDYNFLTGGASQLEGKTWVFAPTGPMNFGGEIVNGGNNWWSQALADQNDCMKDDEYTFSLAGFKFENKSKGAMWGINNGAENQCVPQPATPVASNWSLSQDNGKTILSVSNGETIAWDDDQGTYEVMELSENRLHIRKVCCGGAGVRNYVLVPKGYAPPVVQKPFKVVDINDTFDEPGNFTWSTDQAVFIETFDNPAQIGLNTSDKVARYTKRAGQADEFANVFIDLGYRIDLSQRHIIKLKVFMPSFNDYNAMGGAEDWAVKTLQKQVSVKLQNSLLGGNAYTTQAEVIQRVTEMDQWVELTFDFSAVKDRTDFDKIVVQIGGEGHFNPGIFYLDDFRLMP